MTDNIGLYTYGLAAACYLALLVMLVTQWRVRPLGPALILLAATTSVWATLIASGTLFPYPPITAIQIAELARVASWLLFLLQLLSFQDSGQIWRWMGKPWLPKYLIGLGVAVAVLAVRPLGDLVGISSLKAAELALVLWLGLATTGLLLVEQVYRNASASERWGVKFLCLAMGSGFAYDFFIYAEALLFRQLNSQVWQARGLVFAALIPWFFISIARNRSWRINLYVSRYVVFHTVTLIGAGFYLLCMAVVGYFIKYLGGSWGGVLQVGFFAGAGALLLTLLFSSNLRAHLRVVLSKHFFSYRYDYREEWLRFTEGLASVGQNQEETIIQLMANISLSRSGFLLRRGAHNTLSEVTAWEMHPPRNLELQGLPDWLITSGWVIDIREWRTVPELYEELELPVWIAEQQDLWLIIPLFFQNELEGILFLSKTELKSSLNWEDRDLLKTAGRQAAALLAQQRASLALVEAHQFDAFNRLSAYVIHDLKNILAQQSLMVANAQKHRSNPAFIDDMITTVDNSVKRMQRLMDQMRSGIRTSPPKSLSLSTVLQQAVDGRIGIAPIPILTSQRDATVTADRERLTTVFSHLIQNGQEATNAHGRLEINVSSNDQEAEVTVRDTGTGMSDLFVRTQLFKPFESTKGLTGMGIGAFESREYIRQLGGEIEVESTPGEGSVFTVRLPCAQGGEETP